MRSRAVRTKPSSVSAERKLLMRLDAVGLFSYGTDPHGDSETRPAPVRPRLADRHRPSDVTESAGRRVVASPERIEVSVSKHPCD
ncbi:hypothetical protein F2P81_006575 [Scophthalmus maximus]|uniref:Uncharacterized protein n=1 Tax=Scophthalmus maximus TaxID=52904 RepID=A0A6A4T3F2_SCOMX|nr:hypothetical protein F2P81_006575 [Scophthalmus maximus]